MATPEPTIPEPPMDLDQRIRELEEEEREISARRKRLHERLAFFPSELGEQQEREVSARRRAIHRELDQLRVARNRERDQRGEGGERREDARRDEQGAADAPEATSRPPAGPIF